MILLVHMLFGAAVGSLVNNVYLAILLAFLSHYFLDLIPHTEYSLKNYAGKIGQLAPFDIIKIILDFSLGLLLIFTFKNQPLAYVFGLTGILADGLTVLNNYAPNVLTKLNGKIHDKAHFLENSKKISKFWRIIIQAAIVFVSLLLLLS